MPIFDRVHKLILCTILIIASINAVVTATGQFHGDDEATQRYRVLQMIIGISEGDFKQATNPMILAHHPPVRYALSIPGLLVLPYHELGLRLMAVIFSVMMVYYIYKLGTDVANSIVGYISAFAIAVSGVMTWTIMAFAWSIIVIVFLVGTRILIRQNYDLTVREARYDFIFLNSLILIGALTNFGVIVFYGPTFLIYSYYNRHQLRKVITWFSPFIVIVALYMFFIHVFAPYILGLTSGQHIQLMSRAGNSGINLDSFFFNLQSINFYFLPYVSWLIFASSLWYLARRYLAILLWYAPFLLAWNFYLQGNSGQYIVLCFIALTPFAFAQFNEWIATRHIPKTSIAGITILLITLTCIWNYTILIRHYTFDDRPQLGETILFADGSRKHNVIRPYQEIGEILDSYDDNMRFFSNIGSAFQTFYYNEDSFHQPRHTRYAISIRALDFFEFNLDRECYQTGSQEPDIRLIVTPFELCQEEYIELHTFDGSPIRIYLLA